MTWTWAIWAEVYQRRLRASPPSCEGGEAFCMRREVVSRALELRGVEA
ncbi:hypothetical protein HMPREF9620_00245 [Cutibacterium acnes HL037PA1]|nr:hypothetical protein HMPREF9567_02591 [Cutibacterium acnes HL013PA1]EFT13845.1 hypothetical protein HMPREF9620_00245 [Cutibacterium acnes HL037PA1]EFT29887.1 hypothetical protein HMPREF9594_00086 [Cutibacterium acnes HL005PA1]